MDLLKLKQRLVGTRLGPSVLRVRTIWELWKTVCSNPEAGGMASQDACARLLLPHLCSPSSQFLDVGAHIGSVIAAIRRHHPSIRVIAVEGVPEKASALARTFRNIDVYSCAVGETEGEVTFFVDEVRPGYSSLARNAKAGVREIVVPMRRLDTIISNSANVDVLKLDVEGAELGALRGASTLVARCRPVIFFESGPHGGEALGYTIEALFSWFAAVEYQILVPNRVAHNGPGLALEGFIESHYYPSRTRNYFAVPKERRTEFRDRARCALGVTVKS